MTKNSWNIEVIHPELEERLSVSVVAEFEYEDKNYFVVLPQDEIVQVIKVTGDDEGFEEIDLEDFGPIAELINGKLSEHGVSIKIQANELILVGEPDEAFFEEGDEVEVEGDDGEVQELLVLERIEGDEVSYLVAVEAGLTFYPVIPLEDGNARPLSPEEAENVWEVFQSVAEDIGRAMEAQEEAEAEMD